MTTTETKPEQSRADRCHEIEGKHFGHCLDQVWADGRRTLIERLYWPKTGGQVVLVKQYESAVPRSGSGRRWPELAGVYAYVPLPEASNTWDAFDAALTAWETAHPAE